VICGPEEPDIEDPDDAPDDELEDPELEDPDELVWAEAGMAMKAAVEAMRSDTAAALVHAGARVMGNLLN